MLQGKGYNKHSELLKPEKNTIDHGPKTHKSGMVNFQSYLALLYDVPLCDLRRRIWLSNGYGSKVLNPFPQDNGTTFLNSFENTRRRFQLLRISSIPFSSKCEKFCPTTDEKCKFTKCCVFINFHLFWIRERLFTEFSWN